MSEGETGFRMQRQVRDNAADLQTFLSEMAEWERDARDRESKIKEGESPTQNKKDFPPVRSKLKKDKGATVTQKPPQKRISSSDYSAWEKFDADKACEVVDSNKTAPPSLDSKMSEEDKKEKLRQEAQMEKEKGNNFVQQKNWDKAIECYTRAIELYKDDAIYYANRGLCYLKKEKLHEAEADCTLALQLDPTYIKALQRRSCALEGLGSLRRAACDLGDILRLEPTNVVVQKQLSSLIQRMGTKGPNSKSSPATTPSGEDSPPQFFPSKEPKNVESVPIENEKPNFKETKNNKKNKKKPVPIVSEVFVEAIDKPPHLRSEAQLIRVPIGEIPKGSTITAVSLKSNANDFTKIVAKYINTKNPFKNRDQLRRANERMNKKERANSVNTEDVSNNPPINQNNKKEEKKQKQKRNKDFNGNVQDSNKQNYKMNSTDSKKEKTPEIENFNDDLILNLTVPKSSVQFISDWRLLKGKNKQQSAYLKAIRPSNIPSIFKESLESDILTDILNVLCENNDLGKDGSENAFSYLKSISEVKRFNALAMFMTSNDKQNIMKILNRCKNNGECSDEEMSQMKNKYEI